MKFLNFFLLAQLLGSIAFGQIKITPIRYSKFVLPIKAERTISFTTNEATYLDVDISPDGSTILFSCLGELFSLPSKGGAATQLTRGLAMNRCPMWSPNGKLIAYESDATGFVNLQVTDLAGSFQKVFDVRTYDNAVLRPLWFPDSKQVYSFDKVYHLTGVTSTLPEKMHEIIGFSEKGKSVYFWELLSRDSSALVKYDRSIQIKTRLLVLTNQLFIYGNPRISPAGNWLIYIKYRVRDDVHDGAANDNYTPADSLMALDIRTGKEKLLAHLNIKFPTNFLRNQHYSFSKDSKFLFIGYGGKIHRIEIETGNNDIIPFTANVKVDMGTFNYNTFPVSVDSLSVKHIRSAQRSLDGKHLLFSALNKIYIQDLPNGKPRILVDQPFNQFQPAYSPDGKWICYVSWTDTLGGHLWRIPFLGGKPERITDVAGLYTHPSWSPNGKMLAVVKGENKLGERDDPGNGQLQVISLEDGNVKLTEDKVPLFNELMFSKTGKEIVFTPDQQNSEDRIWPRLVSKDIETKVETGLLYDRNSKGLWSPIPIRQTVLSPDGKYCAFVYKEDLYLSPMADIGGVQAIFDDPAHLPLIRFARGVIDPVWENDGKILSWLDRNHYCSINPDKIIETAQHLQPNSTLQGLPLTRVIDVNIPADHVISINLKASRQKGTGIIAIKNARIITMHGSYIIENGTLLIKDGKIVKIGESYELSIPKEANIIDASGKTVLPGLIDMHSHMYEAVPVDVFLQQSWQRLLHLSYGVTTMRDPSGSFDTFGYSELIETGQAMGPRLFTVGRFVRYDLYNLNSLNEAKIVVSNRKKLGATYIKQYEQPTRLQRQLLLQACKEEGVDMTNEVEKQPLYCMGMYKDGTAGIEHNPEWGDVYNDVIKLVAKSGTYLCPVLPFCYGREFSQYYFRKLYGQEFLNRSEKFIGNDYYKKEVLIHDINAPALDSSFLDQSRIDARIKHAGGKIVMGSHGEDQGIGAHWEIWGLQMGGLTNMEALETATITAAEALGMQKDLGSIEVGKIADLIILDKNPLEDIHNTTSIKYVMKAGVLYDSETLDEIWPEKKKCPEWRMKSDNK